MPEWQKIPLTFNDLNGYNRKKLLAGEGSSLAPLPFPFSNLGASPASASFLLRDCAGGDFPKQFRGSGRIL
jgi:hypothetical protein